MPRVALHPRLSPHLGNVPPDDEKQHLRQNGELLFDVDGANSARFRPTRNKRVTSSPAKALTCSTTAEDARAVFLNTPCSWTLDNSQPFGFSLQRIQKARRLGFFQAVILTFSHSLSDMSGSCTVMLPLVTVQLVSVLVGLDVVQHILEVPEHV